MDYYYADYWKFLPEQYKSTACQLLDWPDFQEDTIYQRYVGKGEWLHRMTPEELGIFILLIYESENNTP